MNINNDYKVNYMDPSDFSSQVDNKDVDVAYNEAVDRINNSSNLTELQKASLKEDLDANLSEVSSPEEKMMVIEQTNQKTEIMEKSNVIIESLPTTNLPPRMFGL